MAEINYAEIVAELIKPLVTHPEAVCCTIISEEGDNKKIEAVVHPDDLGRVIGKKGRVAGAIRTIARAAAIRNKVTLDVDFKSDEE